MEIIERAREFAKEVHKEQKRKINGEPYFTHVDQVAKILSNAGFSDIVVAAGYLHDVIEDTSVTKEDLLAFFGNDVVELVLQNTENKELKWEERKGATIQKATNASLETKALIAADKLNNCEDLLLYYRKYGYKVWGFFNRGFELQAWYYIGLTKALFNGLDDNKIPQFFFHLRSNVEELFSLNKSQPEYKDGHQKG